MTRHILNNVEIQNFDKWIYRTPKAKIPYKYRPIFNSIKEQYETFEPKSLTDKQLRVLKATHDIAWNQVKRNYKNSKYDYRESHYDYNKVADLFYNPVKPF